MTTTSELLAMVLAAGIIVLFAPTIHRFVFWGTDRWDKWRRAP